MRHRGPLREFSINKSTMFTSKAYRLRFTHATPIHQSRQRRRLNTETVVRAESKVKDASEVPDVSFNFVARYQAAFRALPLYAGGVGIIGVLVNRIVSGVAPVVDASSSQSRTDVLAIFMSAILLLTGLQWLSLKPREMKAEELIGEEILWSDPDIKLPQGAADELNWAWEALQACTRVKSLVFIYQGRNLFHAGVIAAGRRPGGAKPGELCEEAMSSGTGNYLANLILYPGRKEFADYLPEGTQGIVVQPVGKLGVMVAGTDTIRGISMLDQAWISAIADKIEVSLDKFVISKGVGFSDRPQQATKK